MPNNGWKNVRPRRRMVSHDKGYRGSEKRLRPPGAKHSFFGGKRWK